MSFKVQPTTDGGYRVMLAEEPPFIVPLAMAPAAVEEELRQGRWLVVSFSIWSVHDREAAARAIALAKQHVGRFKVGLRPFSDLAENAAWLPSLESEAAAMQVELSVSEESGMRRVAIRGRPDASPVWVTIRDGQILTVKRGQLLVPELDELVSYLLGRDK